MSCGVAPYDPTTKTLNAISAFPILKSSYSITPHRYFCAWGMLLCVLLLATRKCALKTRGNIGGCVRDCNFPRPTILWQYGGIWPCSHYSTKIGSFSIRDIGPFTTAPSTILVLQWLTLQHAHVHRRGILLPARHQASAEIRRGALCRHMGACFKNGNVFSKTVIRRTILQPKRIYS